MNERETTMNTLLDTTRQHQLFTTATELIKQAKGIDPITISLSAHEGGGVILI